jgi:hypothetical protein
MWQSAIPCTNNMQDMERIALVECPVVNVVYVAHAEDIS